MTYGEFLEKAGLEHTPEHFIWWLMAHTDAYKQKSR